MAGKSAKRQASRKTKEFNRRTDWVHAPHAAREVAESYGTSVTLRQLFYRLVAAQHHRPTPSTTTSGCRT